jgi:hypothetical protein
MTLTNRSLHDELRGPGFDLLLRIRTPSMSIRQFLGGVFKKLWEAMGRRRRCGIEKTITTVHIDTLSHYIQFSYNLVVVGTLVRKGGE